MSTQFSPQLTHGGIPALDAGLALKHLLTPVAEQVAMPRGRRQPGGIAGEICPEQFHRLELVVKERSGCRCGAATGQIRPRGREWCHQ